MRIKSRFAIISKKMESVYPVISRQQELPFYLSGIGVADPEYHIIRDPGLVSHQFLFTLDGTGVLVVNGKNYRLEPGSLFYMPPGLYHEYYPEQEGKWTTCWMVFRGEWLDKIIKNLGFDGFVQKKDMVTEEIQKIFRRIMTAAKDPVNGGEKCSLLLYDYILAVHRAFFYRDKYGDREIITAGEQNGKRRRSGWMDDSLIYMNEHCQEDITLEMLSEISGVTKQHYCRVFKEQMGMRPLEYLARTRISKARAMLLNSELSVLEIGEKVGYNSPTYFGMVFKKYEGISPSEYKKKQGMSLI